VLAIEAFVLLLAFRFVSFAAAVLLSYSPFRRLPSPFVNLAWYRIKERVFGFPNTKIFPHYR